MALSTLAQSFLESGTYLRGWSTRTVRTYSQGLARLGEAVPTRAGLNALVTTMRQQGVQPGGCNMYIRTINSFLSWLHEEGHIPEPLRIKLLPNPSKPLVTFTEVE